MKRAILWNRLDVPGCESALLEKITSGWRLAGFAAFQDAHQNCGFGYTIYCDEYWRTELVRVSGHIGINPCNYEIGATEGTWHVNGTVHPGTEGCIDIDLGFSPSTNLLPIRRLSLDRGGSAKIKVAWLRFPSMALVLSEQIYTRMTGTQYRYESLESKFASILETDSDGFVTSYPGHWRAEGAT
jgi:hypothetical protein